MAQRPWSTIAQILSANLRLARLWKRATLHLQICIPGWQMQMQKRRCGDGTFHFPGSALSYSYRGTADMNDGGGSWQSPRCPPHLSQSSVASLLAPAGALYLISFVKNNLAHKNKDKDKCNYVRGKTETLLGAIQSFCWSEDSRRCQEKFGWAEEPTLDHWLI